MVANSTQFFFSEPAAGNLKQEEIGLKIRNIYIGTSACCIDLLLISDNHTELMTMIDFTKEFADLEHYIISDTKKLTILSSRRKHGQVQKCGR